jgi:mRNA interferase MazF
MPRRYVPDRGDLVWLQFNPQKGHEQSGRRPAMVVSPKSYNHKTGLALFCPVTSQVKGYPFEVVLPSGGKPSGAVLSDQIKSLDWRARNAKKISKAPKEAIQEVLAKIYALVEERDS